MRTNPVLIAAQPIFDQIVLIHSHDFQESTVSSVQQYIIEELNQIKRLAHQDDKKNDAIYALAAFVDEAILYSSWNQKEKWRERTLQSQLFNEQLAGEGFFDRLESLLEDHEKNNPLLELYVICLHLGFQGKYRLINPERRYQLIEKIEDFYQQDLAEVQHIDEKPIPKWRLFLENLPFKYITLIIFILVYLGFLITSHINMEKNLSNLKTDLMILSER